MSTILENRYSEVPVEQRPRIWPALAASESRRLLRHPAVLASLLVVLALWLIPLVADPAGSHFPYLTGASVTVQYPLLLLAGGTFAGANLIALQPFRHGTAEFESVLSLPRWQQVAAMAVAIVGPALAGLIVAAAQLLLLAAEPGAAGSIQIGELVTVPAMILLAGLLGMFVAEAMKSTPAGFIALFVLGIVGIVGLAGDGRSRWLAFAAGENPFASPPMPAALEDRPEWWHVAWLLGLAAVVAGATLWLAGLRRPMLAAATVVMAVVAALAGVVQLRPMSVEQSRQLDLAREAPAALQECVTKGQATYCAFPEFRNRVDAWAQIVDAQLAVVPPNARPASLNIRQRIPILSGDNGFGMPLPVDRWAEDDAKAGTPHSIPVSTRWAAAGTDSFDETEVIGFSGLVASVLVTGEPVAAVAAELCGSRGAVALWLAVGATAETRQAMATVQAHGSSGGGVVQLSVLNSTAGIVVGELAAALADALLKGDRAHVASVVSKHWTELTAPGTSVQRAIELFGVTVQLPPPTPDIAVCA